MIISHVNRQINSAKIQFSRKGWTYELDKNVYMSYSNIKLLFLRPIPVNCTCCKFIKRIINNLSSEIIKELCAASFYGSLSLKKTHKKIYRKNHLLASQVMVMYGTKSFLLMFAKTSSSFFLIKKGSAFRYGNNGIVMA